MIIPIIDIPSYILSYQHILNNISSFHEAGLFV